MNRSTDEERLRRLLLVVPLVLENQGISVDALAQKLGLTRGELLNQLDSLLMVGKPPFHPDDFLDIQVENDQVWVDVDLQFSKIPALTLSEAWALVSAAQLMSPATNADLSAAVEAVMAAVPPSLKGALQVGLRQVDAVDVPETFAAVSLAYQTQRALEFDYRGESPQRRVLQPTALFRHLDHWYVRGVCVDAKALRHFRLDRMRNVVCTQRSFRDQVLAVEGGSPDQAFSASKRWARVRFNASHAAFVAESWPAATRHADGSSEVHVPGDNIAWLVSWVLSFGGIAEVLEPALLREAVRVAAERSVIAARG